MSTVDARDITKPVDEDFVPQTTAELRALKVLVAAIETALQNEDLDIRADVTTLLRSKLQVPVLDLALPTLVANGALIVNGAGTGLVWDADYGEFVANAAALTDAVEAATIAAGLAQDAAEAAQAAVDTGAVNKASTAEQIMNGDLTIQRDAARIRLQSDTTPTKMFDVEISSTKAQLIAQGGIATEVVGDLTVTGLLTASPESMPGRLLGIQRFTTVGTFTYTPTPGTAFVIVEMYGGGGSGSGAPATGAGQCSFGGPGGAGGYGKFRVAVDFLSATVDIGAGGVAGAAGAAGTDGGTTKLTVVPGTRYFQASGGQRGLPASPYGVYPWASYQGGFYGQGARVSSTPGDIMLINSGSMKADNSLALAVGMLIVGAGGTPFGFPPGGPEYIGSGPGIASYIPLCGSGGRGYGNGPSGAARLGEAGNQGSMTIYEYSGTN